MNLQPHMTHPSSVLLPYHFYHNAKQVATTTVKLEKAACLAL
jgi:hypothetical protein